MNYFRKIQFRIVQKLLEINEILVFQKKVNKVLKSVLDDAVDVIFDIGANKGQSIKLFQKQFPKSKIYSFEPNPKLFSCLKNKYLHNKQVRIFELAISNKNGENQFNENLFDSSSTLEKINPNSKYLKKKARALGVSPENLILDSYLVKTKKLSFVIKELNVKTVDFIKIDVEGHELNCLQGLFDDLNVKIKCIQIEAQSNDLYMKHNNLSEIYDLMKRNGFNQSKKIKHGFGNFSDIIFWRATK